MNPCKLAIAAVLLLSLTAPAFAQKQIGEIAYLEDEVSLTRNGQEMEAVDIGLPVENYDLLATGPAGYAEVEIGGPGIPGALLKITPDTRCYIELNTVGGRGTTTLGMLGGSLAVKAAKLSGRQQVEVATESALMGVRGTSFEVTISPAGDILVTSDEGRVSCIDDGGDELFAEPGAVVEKRPGELFRTVPVAVSSLAQFRREWHAERIEAFKANALKAIAFYARRYVTLKERFDAAYARLQAEQALLRKWADEDREGRVGGTMESLREKKRLIGPLLELRKLLYLFERTYFRLVELQAYYRQGYGRGQIEPNLSAEAFFRRFESERQELGRKMAEIRYITKLYARRNEGQFPTDLF